MNKKIMVLALASLVLVSCGQKKEAEPSTSSSQKQVASSAKQSSSSKKDASSTKASSSTELMVESQTSTSQAEKSSQEASVSSSKQEETSAVGEATSGATIPVIQGSWSSAMGSFTVDGGILTNGTGSFTVKQLGEGTWTLAEVVASPPVYYYVPAGQPLATSVRTYVSDETRDRIFIQPQYDAPQEAFEPYIFYRN